MAKRLRKKKVQESLLTYAVEPEAEQEIREYVDATKRKTGLSKRRIVSDLLLNAVREAKKFCPAN